MLPARGFIDIERSYDVKAFNLVGCGVRIADSLLNKSEEVAFRELEAITNDNALRLFANQRLSDVILKDGTYLPQRAFDFYTRSHVDFVVTDENSKPIHTHATK